MTGALWERSVCDGSLTDESTMAQSDEKSRCLMRSTHLDHPKAGVADTVINDLRVEYTTRNFGPSPSVFFE